MNQLTNEASILYICFSEALMEIIMFNMSNFSEWEKGIVNRNYHVFKYLLNNKKIERLIAVDFLPFTLKRAIRNYLENILRGPKGKIIYRDLTTRCTQINDKLFIFSTIDSFFSSQKVIKKLKLVLKKINPASSIPASPVRLSAGQGDQQHPVSRIVWSYFPMFVAYFKQLDEQLNVFDAVDNWIEHPSYSKYKEKLKENYQIIARKADVVLTVAESLIAFFKSLGREKKTYWVANGVDIEHFQRSNQCKLADIEKIPHPIIGYLGTIQNRIDINLLEYLAQKNSDKSLVLIGPTWPEFLKKIRRPAIEIRRLKKYKNVYFLGRKPYQETPAYIRQFDVAIIPHKLDEFIKYTYSLKLLEYLACGKPIVTTPLFEVEKFSHLVYIAKDYREFNENIQKALSENKPELVNLRIKTAAQHSWQNKIEQMLELIKLK